MKNTKKASLVIFVLAAPLFLIGSFSLTAADIFAAGRLVATPEHVDFGVIEEGPTASATVIIENSGDSPAEITSIRTN